MKAKILGFLFLIVFIATVAFVFIRFFVVQKYSLSDEKADLNSYYNLTADDQAALILDNTILEEKGRVADGTVYLDLAMAQKTINSRFYYDTQNGLLLYTLPDKTLQAAVGEAGYSDGAQTIACDYVPFRLIDDTPYVALPYLDQYSDIKADVFTDPYRVQIISEWGEKEMTSVTGDTQIRVLGGVKSPVLREVSKGEEVVFLEEGDPWSKVRTDDGFIGYIQNKRLGNHFAKTFTSDFQEPAFPSVTRDHKICLAWHQMLSAIGNDAFDEVTANAGPLNTIAPTWFFISDTAGNIYSLADENYVAKAHSRGMEVWATVNDFDGEQVCNGPNSKEETLAIMSSTSARANLISQLVYQASIYGIDGIDVDIEKVSEECDVHFEQFIRELSVACHNNGLVLAVNNYVPTYTPQYNRREEGLFADYLVVMAYDEHGPWSLEVGSVASLPFVDQGIKDTIDLGVPANKILLGVPFYTRLWEETDEGGNTFSFTCDTMNMAEANAAVAEAGAVPYWDETAAQDYATWILDTDTVARIWLENSASINAKLNLMDSYGLAGMAAWKLTHETSDVWDVIRTHMQ